MSNYLTKSELRERTGYAQRPAQRAALLRLGIPFDVDGRGRILVLREQVFGKPKRIAHSPNWDAIKAA